MYQREIDRKEIPAFEPAFSGHLSCRCNQLAYGATCTNVEVRSLWTYLQSVEEVRILNLRGRGTELFGGLFLYKGRLCVCVFVVNVSVASFRSPVEAKCVWGLRRFVYTNSGSGMIQKSSMRANWMSVYRTDYVVNLCSVNYNKQTLPMLCVNHDRCSQGYMAC